MPKKLMDCIEKVKASGKSESEAWAICRKSTGLKPHEGCNVCELVALADHLDELGLKAEAAGLDDIMEKEAQWNWLKDKGRKLKDWYKTEQEVDPQKRQVLTNIRKTHWDLIDKINKAYQLLNNAGKSMNNPSTYVRDLGQALDVLQRDLGGALAASQQQAQQAGELGMGPQYSQQETLQQNAPRLENMSPGGQEYQTEGVGDTVQQLQEMRNEETPTEVIPPAAPAPVAEPPAPEEEFGAGVRPEDAPTELITPNPEQRQQLEDAWNAAMGQPAPQPAPAPQPVANEELVATPEELAQNPNLNEGNRRMNSDWYQATLRQMRGLASTSILTRLLKMADRLDEQGKKEVANKIDALLKKAQLGWAQELGTQLGDKFRSSIGLIDEGMRKSHYNLMGRLKKLYNNLQALRKSVTSPDYPQQFQAAIQAAQEEFNTLLTEAQQLRQELAQKQSAQPQEEQATEKPAAEEQPLSEENLDVSIQEALKTLTPEQKQRVLRLMRQPQGQGV